MTTISAKSILASQHALDPSKRIDTLLLRYPRCIHAEFMTHRMFSRNAASSRAIPVKKLIQDVMDDPFIPLHWGENQKGMQAFTECNHSVGVFLDKESDKPYMLEREEAWLHARNNAVELATAFAKAGYHKQLVNRLLEPFAHITVVVTSTNWSNFLHLRDHPDAEPHIQILAREVRKALEEAHISILEPGEWHLPFVYKAEMYHPHDLRSYEERQMDAIKLSVARCASTSYKTVDGFDMTMSKAIDLHDKLVGMDPLHASPCEHQAKADDGTDLGGRNGILIDWHDIDSLGGNLGSGWIQYRKTLAGECQ